MYNSYLEKYNLELMDNIPVVLKKPLKELITLMLKSAFLYSEEDTLRLLEDLKSKRLIIKVEKVITSQNNVGHALDRIAFGYGYVDYGKEHFLYYDS